MEKNAVMLDPIPFSEIPGWREDDHLAAWKAFLSSCGAVLESAPSHLKPAVAAAPSVLRDICALALGEARSGTPQTRETARRFFEAHFRPHRVRASSAQRLLTGYYEPLIKGSRERDATFQVPIYKRPPDLVNVVAESERGARSESFTHMRQTQHGLAPYLTRAEIEEGGLAGMGLELLYFKDPIEVFFMQVQGSGRVELSDGQKVRVTYDGKNGYPYTSIGRVLIEEGEIRSEEISLKSLKQWLRRNPERAKTVMRKNQSYVFFRELTENDAKGPIGANGIALHAGRSLAIDTMYYPLGMPIYVDAPEITHATKKPGGFRRLMIAHDVGSAIKGTERGDIYFGSGDDAGRIAGRTKHPGRFIVLLPIKAAPDCAIMSVKP